MLTFDENGKALTVTQEGCTMPAEYNFTCVNDFVHGVSASFEDLQALCLGLATQLDKTITVLDELCANAEPVCDCLEMGQTLKSPETLLNFRKTLSAAWAIVPEEN